MEKLDPRTHGRSPDLTAENVAQLKALFPEVFTEGKVDFDALRQLLGDHIDDQAERYGLNWHGKGRARQLAQQPSSGTLRPVQSESVHWGTTQNLFIEGDNLEVLKLLQKSYHRKVKMIYIDPPYNTGKEFIYPDKYQDNLNTYLQYTGQVDGDGLRLTANAETGGRYHTNWLNMMYPRLKLARNLLRDDGVIFVSIDDHEVHNLRHLMDEVFGPENFITQFVWQKKYTRANDAQFASDNHDHIICFSRNYGTTSFNLLSRTADQIKAYTNPDNHPLGPWKSTPLHAKSGSNAGGYLFSNGVYWEPPPGTYRRFSDERMALLESENAIWFGTNGDATPSRKSFLTETKDGLTPVTIWPHDEVGHNHEANDELKKLLGGGVFSNPKPTRLVRRMLTLTTSPTCHDIVLDFFAGSGSTGDAMMQLNAEDGGNRRFVLVQLPEPTGASDYATIAEITKARLRAAARAITEASKGSLPGLDPSEGADLGFRVFKLDSTNIRPWDGGFDDLEPNLLAAVENIKDGRGEEDVLFELLLKYGLDLSLPIEERVIEDKRIFLLGGGALVVCLAAQVTLEVVEQIGALKAELAPEVMRVVFRDASFADDVVKTNAMQVLKRAGIQDIKSL